MQDGRITIKKLCSEQLLIIKINYSLKTLDITSSLKSEKDTYTKRSWLQQELVTNVMQYIDQSTMHILYQCSAPMWQ